MLVTGGRSAARPGLSLLEVLVAMAIFLLSLIGVGKLIIFASDRARELQNTGMASLLAQSKMAEVQAGVVPLSSQTELSFDEAPEWHWSLDAEADSNITGLYRVQVKVSRELPGGGRVESILSQFVLDPATRGSTLDAAAAASAASSSSSSGSSSSSSGGSTGGQ